MIFWLYSACFVSYFFLASLVSLLVPRHPPQQVCFHRANLTLQPSHFGLNMVRPVKGRASASQGPRLAAADVGCNRGGAT